MTPQTWLADLEPRALAALERISASFLVEELPATGPGLATGLAGVAVMHATVEEILPGRGHAAAAEATLDRAIDQVAEGAPGASFFVGILGVAWAIDRLRGSDGEDANGACDEAILAMLDDGPWQDRFDLCKGLVGYATYALGRRERTTGAALLALALQRLGERAARDGDGAFWWTDPTWVAAPEEGRGTLQHVDLGLAHGTPGVVAALARALPVAPEQRPLLEDAVRWLLARRGTTVDAKAYGYTFGDAFPRDIARLGWCYGDLSVAAALRAAGHACHRDEWLAEAGALARVAAARDPERSGVVDAGFCHGSSGVAHMFARLHQAGGDEALGTAAHDWLRRALDAEAPGQWFAGFGSHDVRGWHHDATLLTGAAGVALVLATALGARRPWDELLLVDAGGLS